MVPKESPSELIRAKDVTGFDRWSIPSFDPEVEEPAAEPEPEPAPEAEAQIEEVAIEEVKPLTLEEVEAIRQDAYNEGFATGEKDGFHAGQLKAKQEAEAVLAGKLAQLEQLMGHLLEPIAEQDRELEQGLVDLVSQMTRQVIQRELAIDSSQIRHVLREALKLLPMGAENIRIHLHPQDFELVKALRERHEESWRLLEDDSLLPGGCRVESEHSRIDASVETRLAAALKQLFEQQRAQATNPPEADIQIDLEQPDAP
ncbi:MAG: flagellar assembly protein FliH [Pseudomonadaceae bacterium]|nr:flagellar assembly protein FliH [Pseudomonadaceae bacterium]